ncbi:BRO family protein [Actinocrispum wychmicini]|uniref:Anti-repressor protein n=1 Tax=Actinocrispum wychmicini TaxID=1213861 RepID=A0A4R2JBC3_9PSEU|nr:BRO family protein [Actinocrispum wychmicini]TCO56773.1 anti-repressor protein [Actinocrispum wychmicini]
MSEIEIFNFDNTEIRVVLQDNQPWFVAAEACRVLGYKNGRDALVKHVLPGQKGVSRFATPSGTQTMTVINEPGLYRLIMRSKVEGAARFQDWVTAEVLPTIRKTGGAYIAPGSAAVLDLSDPDTVLDKLIEVAQIAKSEREQRLALQVVNTELEAAREADRPLVEFGQQVCEAANSYSMEEAAKVLRPVTGGLGRNHLLQLLVDMALLIDLKTDERHGQTGYRPYQWCANHFEVPPNTAFVDGRGRKHVDYRTRVRVASLPWLRERIINHLAAVAS